MKLRMGIGSTLTRFRQNKGLGGLRSACKGAIQFVVQLDDLMMRSRLVSLLSSREISRQGRSGGWA